MPKLTMFAKKRPLLSWGGMTIGGARMLLLLLLAIPVIQGADGALENLVHFEEEDLKSAIELKSEDYQNSRARVVSALYYPDITVGPVSWEYFRVEVPVGFSGLSISLTKKKWSSKEKAPMICFRFGAPPLPSATVDSLELAISMAGKIQNASNMGQCAWLKKSLNMNVTNEQVISGLLYVGLFSDPSSSRTQSTMISRGATHALGIQFVVTGCQSKLLGGLHCNRTISILSPSRSLYLEGQNSTEIFKNEEGANRQYVQGLAISNGSSWSTLPGNCVDAGEWSFFVLEIADIVPVLEIMVDTQMKTIARHGALPQVNYGFIVNEGSNVLTVEAPKRGPWYIGVSASNLSGSKTCFTLGWRVQTCRTGFGGVGCDWPLIVLERVLSRATESPFDSTYVPTKEPIESGWFTWKPSPMTLPNVNSSMDKWVYFLLEVPNGASGSTFSIELHYSSTISIEVYARFEGYPTNSTWDFHHTPKKPNTLQFDMIYPAEGMWTIGVLYSSRKDEVGLKLHMSLHGCAKSCSHSGSCTTSYEASRLTFFSSCHCDRRHGGIDCSEALLSSSEKTLQVWALVGSNAAAIFPSLWALRQKAFSEWLIYTTSGVSSAIYHSCDAGGWCALPYDTLQFLDFWLSFLAVVFTCLYMAEVLGLVKTTLHLGTAIITAIIAKSNRTSTKSVVLVVCLGALGLSFGLGLEFWRQNRMQRWHGPRMQSMQSIFWSLKRQGGAFARKLRKKFIWPYVGTGIMIVAFSGLCWSLEKAKTYWIWHSLWHVSIFTGAFVLIFSVVEAPSEQIRHAVPVEDNELGRVSGAGDNHADEEHERCSTLIQ